MNHHLRAKRRKTSKRLQSIGAEGFLNGQAYQKYYSGVSRDALSLLFFGAGNTGSLVATLSFFMGSLVSDSEGIKPLGPLSLVLTAFGSECVCAETERWSLPRISLVCAWFIFVLVLGGVNRGRGLDPTDHSYWNCLASADSICHGFGLVMVAAQNAVWDAFLASFSPFGCISLCGDACLHVSSSSLPPLEIVQLFSSAISSSLLHCDHSQTLSTVPVHITRTNTKKKTNVSLSTLNCTPSLLLPPSKYFTLAINSPGLYSQQLDHVVVNCGSSGDSTAEDTRKWTGDTGSNYITSLHGSKGKLISSKATDQPLPYDPIPYRTARLSRWPFTYTFRVTPGQKLIRLHFYPALYLGGFKRSKAFFTVKAGRYTLLSNFSAALTVDALGLTSLVKEYYLDVDEDQPLIITFSPSRIGNSEEVYAFVNGIEIISMPAALYHTREGNPAAQIVGKSDRFTLDKSIALEKVHRLNVGGSSISPIEDRGMFRDWNEDSNYLLEKSCVKPVTTTIRIKYTSVPPYTAPQKVYQTSWSLIPGKHANKTESNFTWRLPVDLGFRYLLRLHFCELEYEIKESGRMEFSIFVNEHVVEAKVDLIHWSGGSGVAVFKDYVVIMDGERMEGKRDLLIALRPHNHEWTEPIDATVKGLEVFKLSNPDKNLAGVNPVSLERASTSPKPKKLVFASGGNAIATGVVIVLTVLNVIVYQLRSLGENSAERNLSSSTSEGLCRRFSLAELMSVTNNFDDEFVIGRGGFGKVYKALIDDDATMVALKRCNLKSQGAKEFWTEIEMLSKHRHTHLVSLLGYCDERNEMILVYEFMEHGTLADHLYNTKTKGNGMVGYMSWEQRLNICVGAARGLDYLHTGIQHGIIHRDVKTTNILLDKYWIAKISDFGLCKVGSTSHSHTYVSTDVKGTRGYLDPEYYMTRRLTKKSDVYAFGVVMLEMLCGRPAVDMRVDEEQHSLALWAKQCIKENKLDQLTDPSLRDQISAHCLKVFAEVANNCLDSRPKGRPTMADVVVRLEYALASERAVNEQFGENTKGGNRSKGNVSKVFQKAIEFLAKGADIKWKKRKANSQSEGILNRRDTEDRIRHHQLPEDLRLSVQRSNIIKAENLAFLEKEEGLESLELIGRGVSGEVYKAELPGSNGKIIAIKKITVVCYSDRRPNDWKMQRIRSEIQIMGQIWHRNLIPLLAHVPCPNGHCLVYEFMKNGSLEDILNQVSQGTRELDWLARHKIAQGVAAGLEYLHMYIKPRIIHRGLNPAKVLLDDDMEARIADFGLAKAVPDHDTHVTTSNVAGTLGYIAPEYHQTMKFTDKCDIYSFGVLLGVLVIRRLPSDNFFQDTAERSLVKWMTNVMTSENPNRAIDPKLMGNGHEEKMLLVLKIACFCTLDDPKQRPNSKDVRCMLAQITH
ncbi:receptor-like protein kinase FERONIA [Rhododendron vialii]|uniref:receptor-like protein kinase FERONIA n=1 Tax=Rhododendron vialii TaxID=182163 RepID=UPI00265EDD13|nr:receptor-like protein kinase FERONIA [Rhododendron vialii]